jgi:hypothetical protein
MIGNDRSANMAMAMLDFRHTRSKMLPLDMFGEPAWILLLELFVADAQGHRLTGREVSQRCNISASVLSRWLRYLSKCDLIVGDGTGDLTDTLTLSGKGMMSMERAMTHAYDLQTVLSGTNP